MLRGQLCLAGRMEGMVEGVVWLAASSSMTPKSITSSLVSSVPLRLPTAHTSLVLLQRMRHTTPPLPPLSSATRLRMKSPVRKSHNLTVPSSELVMMRLPLNCKQVTALKCLLGPVLYVGVFCEVWHVICEVWCVICEVWCGVWCGLVGFLKRGMM